MNVEIKEHKNKALEKYAVKFHGVKSGDPCILSGGDEGIINTFFMDKGKFLKVNCYNFKNGFSSDYNPDNVSLVNG